MLVDWVLELWQTGSLPNVVDARLLNKYSVDEACLALKLGLLCSHRSPSVKAIGCSSLRDGGGELGSLKILTYGSN